MSRFDGCIPDHLIKRIIEASHDGANCWNASCMYHDDTIPVGYMEQDDMEKWLKVNAFQVSANESEKGDILVLRKGGDLVHTAVLVDRNEKLFFHKGGVAHKWAIESLEFIMDIYGADVNRYNWYRAGSNIKRVA
jgi:hypothetical protein